MKTIKYTIFIFIFCIANVVSAQDLFAEEQFVSAKKSSTDTIITKSATTVQFEDQFVRDEVLIAINNNLPIGEPVQTEVTTDNILYLTNFTLYGYFESIDGLEFAKNVKSLKMTRSEDRNTPPLNINVLSTMTQLELLEITYCKVQDISAISNLTNLDTLNLGLNQIENISPLNTLSKLKVLILNQNRIQDISTISSIISNILLLNVSDQSLNIDIVQPIKNGTLVFENLAKDGNNSVLPPLGVSTTYTYAEPYITFTNIPETAQYLGYQVDSTLYNFNCYITLTLKNNPIQMFSLSFDLNGSTGIAPTSQNVYEGELATKPSDPTRDGYLFKGWNTQADGKGLTWNFTETKMPTNDVTLYAIWQNIEKYSVVYDGNNNTSGVVPVNNNKYLKGDTTTILDKGTLKKSGYTFEKWNTKADGTGISYKVNDKIKVESNLLLYAQWKKDLTADKKIPSAGSDILIYSLTISLFSGILVSYYLYNRKITNNK